VRLTTTEWSTPFFDAHIDFDTLTLHKINKRKAYPQTKVVQFSSSGQISSRWFQKNKDRGCTLGLLAIDKDSFSYVVRGDTLETMMKGEYIGVERFHFKRDYLVTRVNKNEIQLSQVKTYFGEPCKLLLAYWSRFPEETVNIPPRPNTRKKQ
jgi:hypothetical protein